MAESVDKGSSVRRCYKWHKAEDWVSGQRVQGLGYRASGLRIQVWDLSFRL